MTYISEDSLRELEQIDLETIHARYGEDVSMGDYYVGILPRELRLYDLETGSFTVIASTKEDQYAVSTDAGFVYGKKVLYLCGDTLYVFDMDQAESFALITMEGIINYFLRDHKAIFIVEGDGADFAENTIRIYWADLDDGIPVQLGNEGNTEVAVFNPLYECDSFFLGYYKSAYYMIDKADYYADCYENVILAR